MQKFGASSYFDHCWPFWAQTVISVHHTGVQGSEEEYTLPSGGELRGHSEGVQGGTIRVEYTL